MAASPKEPAYQKYAWVLLILGGLLGLIIFLPPPPDVTVNAGPYDFIYADLLRGWVILQLVVGLTLFRKGNKWGWYLVLISWLITFVAGIIGSLGLSQSTGGIVATLFYFWGPALLALLLPYRMFFPKIKMETS